MMTDNNPTAQIYDGGFPWILDRIAQCAGSLMILLSHARVLGFDTNPDICRLSHLGSGKICKFYCNLENLIIDRFAGIIPTSDQILVPDKISLPKVGHA